MVYTQLTTCPATIKYARSLGADGLHIGILGALPTGLFFMQFLSALMVNHLQYRRHLWFWVSLVQRVTFVPIAAAPLLWPEVADSIWIWLLILAATLNHGFTHFGSPLWLSWMGDYLPKEGLSRFWGQRHLWQQWAAAAALFSCAFIFWASGWEMKVVFAGLMVVASIVGVIDILLFIKVHEPPVTPSPQPNLRDVLMAPFRDRSYRSFIEYSCFWNFAAMIGAPFIAIYMLEVVGMDLPTTLCLWAISFVGGAVLSRQFGEWADIHGNRPVLILCTTLKAINMLALLLTPANPIIAFWILIPVLMMDAQLNAGINIANNGFMLKHSPQENRTMFIAAGTAMAGMLGGITAIVAGYCLVRMEGWQFSVGTVSVGGFHVLFALSLVLRIASIWMARRIEEPETDGARHVWRVMVHDVRTSTLRLARSMTNTRRPIIVRPVPSVVSDSSSDKRRNAA